MIKYNVIAVYSPGRDKLLMCQRRQDPFKGLLNLVGGKIEPGEDHLAAAYRELEEEAGISKDHITLTHLMDFTYYYTDRLVEVYVGHLRWEVKVSGNENVLVWVHAGQDFFDTDRFAGDGNIGHIIHEIQSHQDQLLH